MSDIHNPNVVGTFTVINSVEKISTDITLEENSDANIPTEKAVKAYIDSVAPQFNTIYADAAAIVPCTTGGCNDLLTNEYATNDIDVDYLAFDSTSSERAQFKFILPEAWDRGTVKIKFLWSSDTGSTAGDTVEWGIKAGALSDGDAIDAALGTPVTISDALVANNGADIQLTPATASMTIAGSPALGDVILFEIYRNVDGTDDMTEDAWLFGVWIQYKVSNVVVEW